MPHSQFTIVLLHRLLIQPGRVSQAVTGLSNPGKAQSGHQKCSQHEARKYSSENLFYKELARKTNSGSATLNLISVLYMILHGRNLSCPPAFNSPAHCLTSSPGPGSPCRLPEMLPKITRSASVRGQ